MMAELFDLVGMEIYTNDGLYLGSIQNIMLDTDQTNVYGLYIKDTNPLLVEESKGIVVPFRWVASVGDIVLLKHFPSYVSGAVPTKARKLRRPLYPSFPEEEEEEWGRKK